MSGYGEDGAWSEAGRWAAYNQDELCYEADEFSTYSSCKNWILRRFPDDANGVPSRVVPVWVWYDINGLGE